MNSYTPRLNCHHVQFKSHTSLERPIPVYEQLFGVAVSLACGLSVLYT